MFLRAYRSSLRETSTYTFYPQSLEPQSENRLCYEKAVFLVYKVLPTNKVIDTQMLRTLFQG